MVPMNNSGDAFQARATHERNPELHRVSALRVGIAIAALSVAACGFQPTQIDCSDASTGFTLYATDNRNPDDMRFGFTGKDAQGYTRTVSRQEAPRWKCREVPWHG